MLPHGRVHPRPIDSSDCPLDGCKFLIFKALEPRERGFRTNPGQLPLGEIARGALARGDRGVEAATRRRDATTAGDIRRTAGSAGPRSGHRARAAGGPRRETPAASSAGNERRCVHTAPSRSFGSSANAANTNGGGSSCCCSVDKGCPVSSRTSSARWIRWPSAGPDPGCSRGIAAREFGVQRRPAELPGATVDALAQRGVGLRQRCDAAGQRPEIEHRAADEQRHPPARVDCRDRLPSHRDGTVRPSRLRPDRRDRSGGAAPRRARPATASTCRCPCRGRPAPSRR